MCRPGTHILLKATGGSLVHPAHALETDVLLKNPSFPILLLILSFCCFFFYKPDFLQSWSVEEAEEENCPASSVIQKQIQNNPASIWRSTITAWQAGRGIHFIMHNNTQWSLNSNWQENSLTAGQQEEQRKKYPGTDLPCEWHHLFPFRCWAVASPSLLTLTGQLH